MRNSFGFWPFEIVYFDKKVVCLCAGKISVGLAFRRLVVGSFSLSLLPERKAKILKTSRMNHILWMWMWMRTDLICRW